MRRAAVLVLLLALAPAAYAAERRLAHRANSGQAKGAILRGNLNNPTSFRLVIATKPRKRFKAFASVFCRRLDGKELEREVVRRVKGRTVLKIPLPRGVGENADCSVEAGGLYTKRNERGREILTYLNKVRMTADLYGTAGPPKVTPEQLELEMDAPYWDNVANVGTIGMEIHGNPPFEQVWAWERCDANGAACADLPGQVEDSYRTTQEDVGHRVRARLTVSSRDGQDVVHSGLSPVILPQDP